ANLWRGELPAALREIDSFHSDAEFPEQVHQCTRTTAEIQHLLRLKHVLDQKRISRLDLAPRLEVVVVPFGAPVTREVLRIVMAGLDGLLVQDALLELGNVHCWLSCLMTSLRIRVEESKTVSRYTTSIPCSRQIVTCSGGSRPSQSFPFT